MMKHLIKGIIAIAALSIVVVSCRKDEGPIKIPVELAPEYSVSFTNDVQPLFETGTSPQCTACHPTSGNLSLLAGSSYDELVNVPADGYAAIRVVPGDTTNSVLWDKINDYGVYGLGMPPPSGGFSAEDIATIGTWIMEGAADN